MSATPNSLRNPAFGAMVAQALAAAGLSQRAAARRTYCDVAHVSRMVRFGRVPSRVIVERLADALNMSPHEGDALLAVAGYAPRAIAAAGGWGRELAELADFLGDPTTSELDRAHCREWLHAEVAYWRGEGRAIARETESTIRRERASS